MRCLHFVNPGVRRQNAEPRSCHDERSVSTVPTMSTSGGARSASDAAAASAHKARMKSANDDTSSVRDAAAASAHEARMKSAGSDASSAYARKAEVAGQA